MTEKNTREKILINTYTELYRYEQNGDYERALKAANRILHMAPDEVVAFQCKVVCFIQSTKFEDALSFMRKNPSLSGDLVFENAYCLYRTNRSAEALKLIDELEELDYRLQELKAQILYRLEKFTEAFEIYQQVKPDSDDYEDERETNKSAALVYADHSLITQYGGTLREDTYELCFNRACQLISLGQYVEAEKKLRQCEKMCRESFEEDGATEEEIELELSYVKIQMAYIYQKQSRLREAQQLYITTLKLKLDDMALIAVACNNATVINKHQNVFDSKKKMKTATNEQLNHKLLSHQKKYIAFNNALFNYYTNQYEHCRKICTTIDATWPEMTASTTIIEVLNLMKQNRFNDAVEILMKSIGTVAECDKLYLQLALAQIWLMQGNNEKACNILEETGADRYRPGIVGALITMYLADGKEEIAQKTYKETVEWYKVNKKTEGDLTNLWRESAEFHLRKGQSTVAADSLEQLLRSNPDDKKTIAQLVIAYSEFKKKEAVELASKLFTVDEVTEGLDTDTVESSIWLSKKVAPARPDNSPLISSTSDLIIRKKKQKKRKGKFPKFYDPKVVPDPERWLPKYERTGFRKKRDRRAKDVIKGSQGTSSGQMDLFDYSKMVTEPEPQESPASVEPSPVSKHQSKNKGQQKKKNKRR